MVEVLFDGLRAVRITEPVFDSPVSAFRRADLRIRQAVSISSVYQKSKRRLGCPLAIGQLRQDRLRLGRIGYLHDQEAGLGFG